MKIELEAAFLFSLLLNGEETSIQPKPELFLGCNFINLILQSSNLPYFSPLIKSSSYIIYLHQLGGQGGTKILEIWTFEGSRVFDYGFIFQGLNFVLL